MGKPVGRRGSWFAKWKGQEYPCVHKYWTEGHWPSYVDPGVTDEPHWAPFIDSIKERKTVILTTDNVGPGGSSFERTGYIALLRVEDVDVVENELRFRIVDRLESFT